MSRDSVLAPQASPRIRVATWFLTLAWLALVGCRQSALVSMATHDAQPPSTNDGDAGAGSGPGSDANFVLPPAVDAAMTCPACQPGQSCQNDACVDDCRPGNAVACAAPLSCDFISGHCVPPGAGCALTGTSSLCGTEEFAPHCGPGSKCDPAGGCVPDTGCAHVICDASNYCRGTQCPQVGVGGGVKQVTLAPIPDTTAGAAGGIAASALVTADGLCGLSATFELRKDLGLFVSAFNDKGIWRIPFDGGPPTHYITETQTIGGVTADHNGTLYYALQGGGGIRRVPPPVGAAAPTSQPFAASAMAFYEYARITFGPDGLLYAVASQQVFRFNGDGTVGQMWSIPDSTFLTGLVFDKDGSLLAGQHWPTIWRLPPGGMTFAAYADPTAIVPEASTPWNEGLALGLDGIVYVGVFPVGELDGAIYDIQAMGKPQRLLGLAEMMRDVPAVQYSGIHGIAFGVDGSLYFANQNTKGPTGEPVGQVLVRRPSGKIELVAKGLNYDWAQGYDGDIVVSQATVKSVSSAVDPSGHAMGALDAPTTPGVYGVRVLVTDPRTGAIAEGRATVTVK